MLSPLVQAYLDALRARGFAGDIGGSAAERSVYATDNSIYYRLPQAVLFPKHHDDVVRIMALAGEEAFRGVHLTARGGGTGTNGQSLSDGVVVDLSRHMNRILEIDVENRRARLGICRPCLATLPARLLHHRRCHAVPLSAPCL